MVTEREKRALQLAKRAYGYFTHEALNIAKEIIALEQELDAELSDAVVIPVSQPPTGEPDTTPGTPVRPVIEKPVIDPKTLRILRPPYPGTQVTDEQAIAPELDERPY